MLRLGAAEASSLVDVNTRTLSYIVNTMYMFYRTITILQTFYSLFWVPPILQKKKVLNLIQFSFEL
jgi:hypothetical protein